MPRRQTSLVNTSDSAISRELDSKYAVVRMVADNITPILEVATLVAPNVEEILSAGESTRAAVAAVEAVLLSVEEAIASVEIVIVNAAESSTNAAAAAVSATQALENSETAEEHATTAITKADSARESATEALISANTAAGSASIAATRATEALASKNAAAASATTATTRAAEAVTSATTATTGAAEALASRNTAATSAAEAAISATEAATSATEAINIATEAATSATEAINIATEAATSATEAINIATEAATSATEAATEALAHAARTDNPHAVTRAQVGLGNVANIAQVTAVGGVAPIMSSGGTTPDISITAASATTSGVVTTEAQTFTGLKTFAAAATTTQPVGTNDTTIATTAFAETVASNHSPYTFDVPSGLRLARLLPDNPDFNTLVNSGMYNFDATSSLNRPVTAMNWVYLEVIRDSNSSDLHCVQRCIDLNHSNSVTNSWTRKSTGNAPGIWSAWQLEVKADINGVMRTITQPVGTSDATVATTAFVQQEAVAAIQPVTFLSRFGTNSGFMVRNNRLFSTSGNNGFYDNSTTGRGLNGTNSFHGLDNFKQVNIPQHSFIKQVGGGYHGVAFALLENGDLYTWGQNTVGQCGLGHNVATALPTLSNTGVDEVYLHPSQSHMVVPHGRVYVRKGTAFFGCGFNGHGQLGDGTTTHRNTWTSITIPGRTISQLFAMGTQAGATFVVTTDNRIFACGWNGQGQLGDGTTTTRPTFVDVTANWTGGATFTSVKFTGTFGWTNPSDMWFPAIHMLLIGSPTGVARVRACGHNGWGQLGDGTTISRHTPIVVAGTETAVDIMVMGGASTVHILLANGDLLGNGHNGNGQVGVGEASVNVAVPTLVLNNVSRLLTDGAGSHAFGFRVNPYVVRNDNSLWVAGNNTGGAGVGHASMLTSFQRVLLPTTEVIAHFGSFTTENQEGPTYVVTESGNFYGWGRNFQSGLTPSTDTTGSSVPIQFRLPQIN